jgi:prevent-host-death family protein
MLKKGLAMIRIPIADAKNRLSELIARVEAGEEIAVTRRGKPVARLIATSHADAKAKRARIADAFGRLGELRRQVRLEGDIKAIAREGLD